MSIVMDLKVLKKQINDIIDQWAASPMVAQGNPTEPISPTLNAEEPKRELPKDKRVIRTKSTGDRVYLIDETAKTKAWVTSPEILAKLGFELSDVEDVEDSSLLGYAMTASVYRIDE